MFKDQKGNGVLGDKQADQKTKKGREKPRGRGKSLRTFEDYRHQKKTEKLVPDVNKKKNKEEKI